MYFGRRVVLGCYTMAKSIDFSGHSEIFWCDLGVDLLNYFLIKNELFVEFENVLSFQGIWSFFGVIFMILAN